MKFFSLSISKMFLRYFLMMAIVIGGVFSGMHLLTILALPVFLSAILGISFQRSRAPRVAAHRLIGGKRSANRREKAA